jgi:hypothetical protein
MALIRAKRSSSPRRTTTRYEGKKPVGSGMGQPSRADRARSFGIASFPRPFANWPRVMQS